MSNPSKAKGTDFETAIVEFLNVKELKAHRTGSAEVGLGDIHFGANGEWTIEAKAEVTIDMPGYLKQLAAAVERRGTDPFKAAVAVKNRRHSTGDGYAVMRLANYRQLAVYVMILEHLLESLTGVPKVMLDTLFALADEDGLLYDTSDTSDGDDEASEADEDPHYHCPHPDGDDGAAGVLAAA